MGQVISYVLLSRNKNLNSSSSSAQGKEGQALADSTTNGAEKVHEDPVPTFNEILEQAIRDTNLTEINSNLASLSEKLAKLQVSNENPYMNSLQNIQKAYNSACSTNNQFLLNLAPQISSEIDINELTKISESDLKNGTNNLITSMIALGNKYSYDLTSAETQIKENVKAVVKICIETLKSIQEQALAINKEWKELIVDNETAYRFVEENGPSFGLQTHPDKKISDEAPPNETNNEVKPVPDASATSNASATPDATSNAQNATSNAQNANVQGVGSNPPETKEITSGEDGTKPSGTSDETAENFTVDEWSYLFQVPTIDELMKESDDELEALNKFSIKPEDDFIISLDIIGQAVDMISDVAEDRSILNQKLQGYKDLQKELKGLIEARQRINDLKGQVLDRQQQLQIISNQYQTSSEELNVQIKLVESWKTNCVEINASIISYQANFEEGTAVREECKAMIEQLTKASTNIDSYLSQVHLYEEKLPTMINALTVKINNAVDTIEHQAELQMNETIDGSLTAEELEAILTDIDLTELQTYYGEYSSKLNEWQSLCFTAQTDYEILLELSSVTSTMVNNFISDLFRKFEEDISTWKTEIGEKTKLLEANYRDSNEKLTAINTEVNRRLSSQIQTQLKILYNLNDSLLSAYISATDKKSGSATLFNINVKKLSDKSFKVNEDGVNINSTRTTYDKCEEFYFQTISYLNSSISTYQQVLEIYNSTCILIDAAIAEEKLKVEMIERERQIAILEPKLTTKLSEVQMVKTSLDNYISQVSSFKADIDKWFGSEVFNKALSGSVNEDVIKANSSSSSFIVIQDCFIQSIMNIQNTCNAILQNIKELSMNMKVEANADGKFSDLNAIEISIAAIQPPVISNDVEAKFNEISSAYSSIKLTFGNIFESMGEDAKAQLLDIYKSSVDTFDKAIGSGYAILDDSLNKITGIRNEMNSSLASLDQSEQLSNVNLIWKEIKDFVKESTVLVFEARSRDYDQALVELNKTSTALNEWLDTFDSQTGKLIQDQKASYEAQKANLISLNDTSFSTIESSFKVLESSYETLISMLSKDSLTACLSLKTSFDENYALLVLNLNMLVKIVSEARDDAILRKRDITRFANAAKILSYIYGHYYIGKNTLSDDSSIVSAYSGQMIQWKAWLQEEISKSLIPNPEYPMDVFKTLANYGPILPLIWPTGSSDIENQLNTFDENLIRASNGDLDYSQVQKHIDEFLPAYISGPLVQYICSAIINTMDNPVKNPVEEMETVNEDIYEQIGEVVDETKNEIEDQLGTPEEPNPAAVEEIDKMVDQAGIPEEGKEGFINIVIEDFIREKFKEALSSTDDLLKQVEELRNGLYKTYINYCKDFVTSDEEFVVQTKKMFDGCTLTWKLISTLSGKQISKTKLTFIPSNYPLIYRNNEIDETVIILLNRIFSYYGKITTKGGSQIYTNESADLITKGETINGGLCISYDAKSPFDDMMKMSNAGFSSTYMRPADALNKVVISIKTAEPYIHTEITHNGIGEVYSFINPTRYIDYLFKETLQIDKESLSCLGISNFIGNNDETGNYISILDVVKVIRDRCIANLSFDNNWEFKLSTDYIFDQSLYEIVYAYVMEGVDNWQLIFPLLQQSQPPFQLPKINRIWNERKWGYLYKTIKDMPVVKK